MLPFDCPDIKVFTNEGEHILPIIEINSKRFCWGLLIEVEGSSLSCETYRYIIVYKTNIYLLKPNVVSKCSREVVKFPNLGLCYNFVVTKGIKNRYFFSNCSK